MTKMHICECDTPTPWKSNTGVVTNVCKVCKGRIDAGIPPEIGRLHTRLDAVLLGDLKLDEDHPFITHLVETVREDMRQKYGVWKNNRDVEAMKANT